MEVVRKSVAMLWRRREEGVKMGRGKEEKGE